jgi:hypothetical protein
MPQYDNTNRGALFKNDRKEHENHPDLSGQLNIDGKEYWLSGWTKRNDDGSFKVLSLSIKPKEQNRRQSVGSNPQMAPAQSPPTGPDFQDDDIPF